MLTLTEIKHYVMSLIENYLSKKTPSSNLATFRIFFGLLMFISLIRFWSKGWIKELYVEPLFHFSYYGFSWVKPLGEYTYIIFFICILSTILITIGYKYRFSIILFFISFTFIELMDKTTYLNHYYYISILSFLMIFIPANASYSVDNLLSRNTYSNVPKWSVDSIKLLISIVYFYAAIAKLNSDWLFDAMPLKIWLSANYDLPILGYFFQKEWIHYFMSWSGFFYDLLIPFMLIYSRTRFFAFVLVIVFHLLTKLLFPIGMFPYIMIFSALIFFPHDFHTKIINFINGMLRKIYRFKSNLKPIHIYNTKFKSATLTIIVCFFILQILIPFRYLLYPGNLLWHEQGYRFSWRVMLVEKTGIATFRIYDPNNDTSFFIDNSEFLTPLQEKQMSFQPDFILEYAHFLGNKFSSKGEKKVEVYVENFVSLNGRRSQRLVDNKINLNSINNSLKNKTWILPLDDEA